MTAIDTMLTQVYFIESVLNQASSSWFYGEVKHLTLINGTIQSRELLSDLRSLLLSDDGRPNNAVMSSCEWKTAMGQSLKDERNSARAFIDLSDIYTRLPSTSSSINGE